MSPLNKNALVLKYNHYSFRIVYLVGQIVKVILHLIGITEILCLHPRNTSACTRAYKTNTILLYSSLSSNCAVHIPIHLKYN